MARLDFDPGVDGFPFGNFWEFDDVERQQFRDAVEAHLNRLRDRGGAVFGGLARFAVSRAIAPIREKLEEGLEPGYGLCGGMAYAALDFYRVGAPIPWLSGEGERPESGSALRNYLWKRQLQSFTRDLDRFLIWLVYLNWIPARWPFSGGPEWLVRASRQEWLKLKGFVDSGSPIPVGLVRDTKSVFECHQVLALGYDEEDDGSGIIYLYDPNCPKQESTIRMGFESSLLLAEETCPGTRPLRGFFCEDYEFVEPPTSLIGKVE
jgi:hypothetical protein